MFIVSKALLILSATVIVRAMLLFSVCSAITVECCVRFLVEISGENVSCSVVFGTLVGVSVFSVMWSELLMASAISCPLWSSVYECQ